VDVASLVEQVSVAADLVAGGSLALPEPKV